MTPRDILLHLSLKHDGDWDRMFASIKAKEPLNSEEVAKSYERIQCNFLTLLDPDYPVGLTRGYQPPFLLYYYGDLQLLKKKYRLTCVGTRTPTLYQNDKTYSLIQEAEGLFDKDLVILSGMAIGLDSAALRAAMSLSAPIIVIAGSGIDKPYPSRNQDIYLYCKSGKGLILSEYPNTTPPLPGHFVFRNRILAALSEVLFVGGGKNVSGTSSTVNYALDNNKDVLALPCNVTGDDLTNSLISLGATPILSAKDIYDAVKSRYDSLD